MGAAHNKKKRIKFTIKMELNSECEVELAMGRKQQNCVERIKPIDQKSITKLFRTQFYAN